MNDASMNSINQLKGMIETEKVSKADYLRPKQGAERYNMSRTSFSKLALEAGAVYKINSMVLINKEIFEQYLETYRLSGFNG